MILAHNLNIYLTKENNFNLLVIFIILNLLFFTKLVGLFANLAIVFLFLYFFLIEKKIYFKLICVCFFALIIPLIYLLINHHLTGHYTGYPRGFRDSYNDQLFYLFKAISIEMNYLISSTVNNFNIDKNNWNAKYVVFAITFILQIFPLIFVKNKKIKLNFSFNKFFNNKMNIIVTFFIIFYFFPVYSLLLLTNVDPIYFRTISPMSFLLFFLIFINIKKITNFFINYMVYLISISFFINLLFPLMYFNFLTH